MRTYDLLVDYWFHGLTDSAIALDYGLKTSTITSTRRYYSIPGMIRTGRVGELIAKALIESWGYSVVDMNITNKTAPYDLLVDGNVRIDVKTSKLGSDNKYRFQLSNKLADKCKHRLAGKRTRKDYTQSCDLMMFVCMDDEQYYLIPPEDLERIDATVVIGRGKSVGKYEKYKIKNRHDMVAAIKKLDTSIVAPVVKIGKVKQMKIEEIVYENERKVINLLRGAVISRGLFTTYSVGNSNVMNIHIMFSGGSERFTLDLEQAEQVEAFQLGIQRLIEVEDLLQ